jgi:hypothetical protein
MLLSLRAETPKDIRLSIHVHDTLMLGVTQALRLETLITKKHCRFKELRQHGGDQYRL